MTQNVFSCHGNVAVAQIDDDGICLLKYLTNPEKKINRVKYFKTDSNRRLSWKIKIDWQWQLLSEVTESLCYPSGVMYRN